MNTSEKLKDKIKKLEKQLKKQEVIRGLIYKISSAVQTTTNMDAFCETIYNELNKVVKIPNFLIGLYQKESYSISVIFMKDEKSRIDEYPLKRTCSEQVIQTKQSLILYDEDIIQLVKKGALKRIGFNAKVWLGVPLLTEKNIVGIIIAQSYDNKYDIDESHLKLFEYISNQIALLIKRKQADDEIRRLNQRNALILNSAGEGIIGMDTKGRHTFVNPSAASILGYSADELMSGQNCSLWCCNHVCQNKNNKGNCPVLSVIDKKEILTNRTEMFCRKNKENLRVEYTSTPIMEAGEVTGIVLVFKDISEQLKLEYQLVQIQKIESIGTLAGGIAHDFNNILTSINGHAELMSLKLDDVHPLQKDISSILYAGKQAAELTSQLLAFSRKQIYSPKIIDINKTIENALKMQRRLISEDISINTNFSSLVPRIKADPLQVEQILMNLIVNARDAVTKAKRKDENGEILISTGSAVLDDNYIQLHPGSHSGYFTTIFVSDNGVGMSKRIRDKIFEPFYTTKEIGKGTGLGLATVYGIIKQNSGYITVYSEVGEGTTFKIYWPAINEDISHFDDENEKLEILYGNETILIVEDDSTVRHFVISALKTLGYVVVSASNGEDALKIVDKGKQHFDLLLTDIIMPGMSGEVLSKKVINSNPSIKVLYTSGYSENHIVTKGLLKDNIHFIQKPYSIQLLSKKIRNVLKENA